MFLVMCFLPVVLAVQVKTTLPSYNLHIEANNYRRTLKNVEPKSGNVLDLDLSNMNLREIDENALRNIPGIKSLNLSNNRIEFPPDSVFSSLTNLEYLSLANSNVLHLEDNFVNLTNLQTLDLSNNPLFVLKLGEKSLSKFVTIITKHNLFRLITNVMHENEPEENNIAVLPDFILEEYEYESDNSSVENMKVCMTGSTVRTVSLLDDHRDLTDVFNCIVLTILQPGSIFISGLGVTGFQKGWFKPQGFSTKRIMMLYNAITALTEDTLNDLPADIIAINFDHNKIKNIRKGVIRKPTLRSLSLDFNEIEYIEADAFADTSLKTLSLRSNKITDISFVSSLPQSMKYLRLLYNQITSIPDGTFARLSQLDELFLESNIISRLENHALDGLTSLKVLMLGNNNMTDIEPEAFKDLVNLEELNLEHNHLVSFPANLWSRLKSLKDLRLDDNRITKINNQTFIGLPASLENMYLKSNGISDIESDSFNGVPKKRLILSYNEISNIPRGALNLPKLKELYLAHNKLTAIDPDSYETLPELQILLLSYNNISNVDKGACKNFGNLRTLDISGVPLRELKQGALYGLSKEKFKEVDVYGNGLEMIHSGVFEDI